MSTLLASRLVLLVVPLASLVAACSGDARPFEEAVEVRELGLESLVIEPPANLVVEPSGSGVPPLTLSPGERVDFGLSGSGAGGVAVELSGEDRDWRVADPAVATIDEDGRLLARADGMTTVSVRIGDVVSAPFELRVSTATLEAIDGIDRSDDIDGMTPLDPCAGVDYGAIGLYDDGSRRRLIDPEWRAVGPGARLLPLEGGGVRLVATTPGSVTLSVLAGGLRLDSDIEVADTLREITIGPATLAASVGGTQELGATGRYVDAGTDTDSGARERVITDAVTWSVESGDDAIAIDASGVVSALAAGTATVRAACGEVFASETYSVSAASGAGELSFENEENGRLQVVLGGGEVQLRVSTGDEYDRDDDVTEDAEWRLIAGAERARLDIDGDDRGRFLPLAIGVAEVEVSYLGDTERLIIDIVDTSF